MEYAKQPLGALTDREAQVLALLRRGLSNKEIARILNVSEGTVKQQVHGIFNKHGVRRRAALMYALSSGAEQ